ncbi:MAG TPA: hypothetical protein VD908_04170 [Cytophagales bacterium]|nr:hypothetical protein [Cytophagales bacterium]
MLNKYILAFIFSSIFFFVSNAQEIVPEVFQKCPRIHIENAIEAMGGRDTLKSLKSIYLDGYGHRYKMDQSERAEGPYLVEYLKFEEIRDVNGRKIRRSIKTIPVKSTRNVIISGVVFQEEDKETLLLPDGLQEELFLSPETALFTALKAKDLNCDKHVTVQGIVNNVVRFSWKNFPVKLYLNSFTNLLTAIEITRPYPYDNYGIWGDIKTVYSFSDWASIKGGIWYPLQWNIEQNGMPYKTLRFIEVKINQPVNDKDFTIPQEIVKAQKERTQKKPSNKPIEIQPGIWKLKDTLSTYFVKQSDGLLILDAPYSSSHSAETIKQIKQLFPNAWLKGVVSTSDSWEVIGGLREYAASNIPIFSLDLNKGIIEKLLKANYETYPDKYSNNIYKFKLNPIYQDFTQGEGLNKMLIFPLRSESGERNLIIYFPELQMVYASDLLRKDKEGNWKDSQKIIELNKALVRKGFDVKDVFSMYLSKTSWPELLKELERK